MEMKNGGVERGNRCGKGEQVWKGGTGVERDNRCISSKCLKIIKKSLLIRYSGGSGIHLTIPTRE